MAQASGLRRATHQDPVCPTRPGGRLRKSAPAQALGGIHLELMVDDLKMLAQEAARGDARAFESLLQCHMTDLQAFVRLRTGPMIRARESCSDIVQSVCREILEHADGFCHPREEAFKRWLFTTAQRKILQRQRYYKAEKRDEAREVLLGDEEHIGSMSLGCHSSTGTPIRHAQAREEVQRIEASLEGLPDDYREVIWLAHVAGLGRKEIGEAMGRSEGAVRVLLHRAVARISSLITHDDG